jgi:hypothetical protein
MSVFEAKINSSYITGNDIREFHHWCGKLILGSNISSGKSAFGLGCMPFLALA